MLFTRLLETQRATVATEAMLEGAGISALVHGLLIGTWLLLSRDVDRVKPEPFDVFTPVEYLVPKDRIAGMRPQRETVTWTTLAFSSRGSIGPGRRSVLKVRLGIGRRPISLETASGSPSSALNPAGRPTSGSSTSFAARPHG